MYIMVQTRRRTTRHVKKPDFYTPEETILEDDYTPEEHESDVDSSIDTDEDDYSDEESEDDEGSLKDFIDDDEESEEEHA